MGVDDITLGRYKVKGQSFGMIIHEDGHCFKSGVFSGIWGAGFPELEDTGTNTLFDNLMKQYKLTHNVFSFHI